MADDFYLEPFHNEAMAWTVLALVIGVGFSLGLLFLLLKVLRRRDADRLDEFTRGGER